VRKAVVLVALLVAVGLGFALCALLGPSAEPTPGPASTPSTLPPSPALGGASEATPPLIDVDEAIRRRLDGDLARHNARSRQEHEKPRATESAAAPREPGVSESTDDDDDSAARPADPTLVFSASAEGIRAAVDESAPAIRECYSSWLRNQPDLSGKLTVQFLLAVDSQEPEFATVSDVELHDSELGHVFMEGCVASLFEELQFEAPEGGELTVQYPLVFLAQ
jgi:hypothetical protein